MSTSAITEKNIHLRPSKPSFFGLVHGELFKISRQWSMWIMLLLFISFIVLPYLISFTVGNLKDTLSIHPLNYFYSQAAENLGFLRVFSGFVLLILTARVVGQEYDLGTIRILLARGVGRVQLLLSKLTAIVIWAIILLLIGLALNTLLTVALVGEATGNLNAFSFLTSRFWYDIVMYTLAVVISMGSTILMATAVTVIGRSLAFGLSVSIIWFPVDNILVTLLLLAYTLTKNSFWPNVSAYLLGPNLNVMSGALSGIEGGGLGSAPLVNVDGAHTLVVTLVYALIFAVVAIVLIWKRDIKE
jgi:ABC-2 type transport system permease protein